MTTEDLFLARNILYRIFKMEYNQYIEDKVIIRKETVEIKKYKYTGYKKSNVNKDKELEIRYEKVPIKDFIHKLKYENGQILNTSFFLKQLTKDQYKIFQTVYPIMIRECMYVSIKEVTFDINRNIIIKTYCATKMTEAFVLAMTLAYYMKQDKNNDLPKIVKRYVENNDLVIKKPDKPVCISRTKMLECTLTKDFFICASSKSLNKIYEKSIPKGSGFWIYDNVRYIQIDDIWYSCKNMQPVLKYTNIPHDIQELDDDRIMISYTPWKEMIVDKKIAVSRILPEIETFTISKFKYRFDENMLYVYDYKTGDLLYKITLPDKFYNYKNITVVTKRSSEKFIGTLIILNNRQFYLYFNNKMYKVHVKDKECELLSNIHYIRFDKYLVLLENTSSTKYELYVLDDNRDELEYVKTINA